MRIILTHEQADFDALASMLGAWLLDESALPVLPRRMNRNVRAFLTLYGADLPFVDPRDLTGEALEEVTLVDTQAAVSTKGMSAATRYRVIDHHPLREGLPPDWEINATNLGATTTMLVEELRERDGLLNPIQATLLLLGIYEDTGSLTYSRTTPRDLRAAAFLIEQGGSLTIAATFINHPLSHAQQAIYDRLRAHLEQFHIHGHTVLLACADAQDTDEELSSIVHKLRDLLDPDALFVLVTTRGGVQVIARSTSDGIDVAEILAPLGGGGHARAAAGLVRGRDLDSVRSTLINALYEHIRPAVTVAQIMSRGPQVLTTTTLADEALSRMQRYGYEGYPVVQADGGGHGRPRVVGLLTRRAVDRTISHRMNKPASSLMDAGEVTIGPDASIEELQRLMTDTGWGQIPVVQPETGEIIGIVTRTDLLKTFTSQTRLPGRQNLAGRLETTLPPARLALLKAVAQVAYEHHAALYIVGGFVRDLLLDRPSLDVDLVVEGDAIALGQALSERYGGRVISHSRFGTAKWQIEDIRPALVAAFQAEGHLARRPGGDESLAGALPVTLDLVTARTEFYTHPTALPTVERGSIKLDLHRRDFTMNTLALRLDGRHYGELLDYWGGLSDLRHGLVRVLHSLSFVDDPTRMLRAVRFEQRFEFRIEARTLELLVEALPLMDRVSGDRIRHELNHALADGRAPAILARLDELHLLEAIHPSLKWDNWLQARLEVLVAKMPDADWGLLEQRDEHSLKRELAYILWLLRLSPEQARSASARLKLASDLTATIAQACALWQDLPSLAEAPPSVATTRLDEVPALACYAVYLATSDLHLRKTLQAYTTRWRKVIPTLTGRDLQQRGLPPGPAYKTILAALRRAWLDGEIHSAEEESTLLDTLIRAAQTKPPS